MRRCRFGLAADPTGAAALRGLARALLGGATFAAATITTASIGGAQQLANVGVPVNVPMNFSWIVNWTPPAGFACPGEVIALPPPAWLATVERAELAGGAPLCDDFDFHAAHINGPHLLDIDPSPIAGLWHVFRVVGGAGLLPIAPPAFGAIPAPNLILIGGAPPVRIHPTRLFNHFDRFTLEYRAGLVPGTLEFQFTGEHCREVGPAGVVGPAQSPGAFTCPVIPEPGTMVLLGPGLGALVGLVALRKLRRR